MKPERIQKIISNYGNYSRRQVEVLIEEGKVYVNGKKAFLGQQITIEDEVFIKGQKVNFKTKHLYYLVNKPKGYISSRIDKQNKKVIDLVPFSNRNLFTIGRLDVNTTGLIIVTTDGELSNLIQSPKNKVIKTYLAWLESPLKKEDIYKINTGIEIYPGVVTKPVHKFKILNKSNTNFLVKISIYEGKKNQIRKMFEALDNRVINLKRIQIGGLILDDKIEIGSYRKFNKQEIYDKLNISYK